MDRSRTADSSAYLMKLVLVTCDLCGKRIVDDGTTLQKTTFGKWGFAKNTSVDAHQECVKKLFAAGKVPLPG